MALKSKLDQADLALAIILQDPVLFGEFMRNTADASKDRNSWPKRRFKYRWYQKDLLTDKNNVISVSGGRAIGKCAVASNKLLTTKGYIPHYRLSGKRFIVWSFDENRQLVKKRAVCIPQNHNVKTWHIQSAAGHAVHVSGNHPILTNSGFKAAQDITLEDKIAVATKIPHVDSEYDHKESEMRLLGYLIFQDFRTYTCYRDNLYKFKSESVRKDVIRICNELGIACRKIAGTDEFSFYKSKVSKNDYHPITNLFAYFGLNYIRRVGWYRIERDRPMPRSIMELGESNLTSFLEAFLAQYAKITPNEIRITVPHWTFATQIQELLLRYGIETRIEKTDKTITIPSTKKDRYWNIDVVALDRRAIYRILTTFTIPGYRVGKLQPPAQTFDAGEHYRFDRVVSVEPGKWQKTYAVQVEDTHTYIVENMYTHNSFVLEDKMVHNVVNSEHEFPETPELILTTANQNQMTPLLDRLTQRFYASQFLKIFVGDGLNRQKGTFDFKCGKRSIRYYTRLAGSRESNNVVGLHTSKAIIDEQQLYPLGTFNQLQKSINTWEQGTQIFAAGVPAGLRNTTLYYLDQKMRRSKKYRIPSPNNPFFTKEEFDQSSRDYGGEESDMFLNLVLGRHGKGAELVITRDDIQIESFDFNNYSYRSSDKYKGLHFSDRLKLPNIAGYEKIRAGIDVGFSDPTIICCFGYKNNKWYLFARYLLQRIETPEQEIIIHWLDQHFQFEHIMIDLGNIGAALYQSMKSREQYGASFQKRLHGITFQEKVLVSLNERGNNIMQDSKTVAGDELIKRVHAKTITMSVIDSEAISQLERIARQKLINGEIRYYIMGESGKGVAKSDHIFAAMLCFAFGIRNEIFEKSKKRLGRTKI